MKTVTEGGQKSDDRRDTLIQELRTLRKGSGLQLRRLRQATTLRDVIAERLHKPSDEITPTLIHHVLLEEMGKLGESIEAKATRNALAIQHKGDPGNITTRRSDFAVKYDRHPDTVEAYENNGIEEIASRLLGSVPSPRALDDNLDSANPALTSNKILSEEERRTTQDMITMGLQRLYSVPSHAKDMIKAFGRATHPFVDVNIEWLLLPSNRGDDWYIYHFKYMFRAAKRKYLIAVVASTHDCEVLMSAGVVDDVMVLSSGADYDEEVCSLQRTCRFVIRDQARGVQQALQFDEVDEASKDLILQAVWPIDTAACRILQVELPQPSSHEHTLCEYLMSLELRVEEHYCFWWAPCLMQINNIVVDVSRFPNRSHWKFFIQPFLGTLLPGGMEPTGDRYTLPAGEWIMPGHGIAIIWQEAGSQ